MRLLPRIGRLNSKTEVWPGGPQLGQVVQAQLNPPATAGASTAPAEPADDGGDETAPEDHTARDLLLLLR